MCVIVAKFKNKKFPSKNALTNCNIRNSHGIGIATLLNRGDSVIVKKDFKNVDELHKYTRNLPRTCEAIIHFRFATHGKRDEGNRHPFKLSNNISELREVNYRADTVVAHNGIINHYNDDEKLSDTMLFIKDILFKLDTCYHHKGMSNMIGNYIGSDKLAFLDTKRGITLIGDYIKYKGCLYSNSAYTDTIRYGYDYGYGYGYGNYKNDGSNRCDFCGGRSELFPYNCDGELFQLCEACGKLEEESEYNGHCYGCGKHKKVSYNKEYTMALCEECETIL